MAKSRKSSKKRPSKKRGAESAGRLAARIGSALYSALLDFCHANDLEAPKRIWGLSDNGASAPDTWSVFVPLTFGMLSLMPVFPDNDREDFSRLAPNEESGWALLLTFSDISASGSEIRFFSSASVIEEKTAADADDRGDNLPDDGCFVLKDSSSLPDDVLFRIPGSADGSVIRFDDRADNLEEHFADFLDEWLFGPDSWRTAEDRLAAFWLEIVCLNISRNSPASWTTNLAGRTLVAESRITGRADAAGIGKFSEACREILEGCDFRNRHVDLRIDAERNPDGGLALVLRVPAAPGKVGGILKRIPVHWSELELDAINGSAKKFANLIVDEYGLNDPGDGGVSKILVNFDVDCFEIGPDCRPDSEDGESSDAGKGTIPPKPGKKDVPSVKIGDDGRLPA